MLISTAGQSQDNSSWGTRRLWSLWDMHNFRLRIYLAVIDLVREDIDRIKSIPPQAIVHEEEKFIFKNRTENLTKVCAELSLRSTYDRIIRAERLINIGQCTYGEVASEWKVLIEIIEDELKEDLFYHYPQSKGHLLTRYVYDWGPTIKAFSSVQEEIREGVDCYALGHETAAVFHMMRVAEYGLRALSRERQVQFPNKPIEWAQWQTLLDEIDKKVKAQWGNASAGPEKDAALDFYNGALGQFHAFKDKYRNAVMHVRKRYDELEALSAINHVRDFMNGLSARIGEKTKGTIRKWP